MSPADILRLTRKQPFEPFRLVVTDGTTYDIRHPEFCMVLQTSLIVGIPGAAESGPAENIVWLDPRHVLKIIPLPQTVTGSNGTPTGNGPQA